MKQKLLLWLTVFALLTPYAAAADTAGDLPVLPDTQTSAVRTLMKSDFNNYNGAYNTSERPHIPDYWDGWGTAGGGTAYPKEVDAEHGKSLCLQTSKKGQYIRMNTNSYIKWGYSGDFTVSLEFMSTSNAGGTRTFRLMDKSGETINIGRWKADGSFLIDNDTNTTGYYVVPQAPALDRWHTYKVRYTASENTISVYMDGAEVISDIKPKGTIAELSGFQVTANGENDAESNICIDNTAIYTGKSDIDFSALPEMTVAKDVYQDTVMPNSIKRAIVLKINSASALVNGEKKRLDEGNSKVRAEIYTDTAYVPIRFIAEYLGADVSWDGRNVNIYFSPDLNIVIDTQSTIAYANDKKLEITKPLIKEDRVFVPLRVIAEAMGKKVNYFNDGGLITVSDTAIKLEENTDDYELVKKELTYSFPSAEEIKEAFHSQGRENVHPRIMLTPEKLDYIKANYESDEYMSLMWQKIKALADSELDSRTPVWNPNENGASSNLASIGIAINSAKNCSLAYLLTGDEKYKNRVWEDAAALVNFTTWNHPHFLDTAEATAAVSIAYDWLYNYWTEEEREFLRNGIKEKGLYEAYRSFKGSGWYSWTKLQNNWSGVCNGGIGIGAIALLDSDTDYCAELLSYNFKSLPNLLKTFAPEGAFEEGVDYWTYAMRWFVPFLSACDNTIGGDFGYIDDAQGAHETAYYPIHSTGPAGSFNYHDCVDGFSNSSSYLYFSDRFNDKGLTSYRISSILNGKISVNAEDLIWYKPENLSLDAEVKKDKLYKNIETVTFCGSWTDSNSTYVGLHGGYNNVNHGHLDIGTFVMDAWGTRFFMDLGSDSYALKDTYGKAYLNSENFYRRRAEGHNTVVINPPGNNEKNIWYDQEKDATGNITEYVSKPKGAYAKMDMSQSNSEYIISGMRGIMLAEGRKQVILRDEFSLTEPSDVWWFAHTKADIKISDDGRSAVLNRDGKMLRADIMSEDADLTFSQMDARPLTELGSPDVPGQNQNVGVKKLFIRGKNKSSFNVSVVFTPILSENETVELPSDKALDEWEIADGELDKTMNTSLTSISADGKQIDGFNEMKGSYEVNMGTEADRLPVLSATCSGSGNVQIIQAQNISDTAYVVLEDGTNGNKKYYSVDFVMESTAGLPENLDECEIRGVSCSAEPQKENPKESSFDGSLDTRWSAEGTQWITYDLGAVKPLRAVSIAWYKSDTRASSYTVQVSEDGINYKSVFSGVSRSDSLDYNTCKFPAENARYVKIIGYGNSENNWNSISEIKVFAVPSERSEDNPQ